MIPEIDYFQKKEKALATIVRMRSDLEAYAQKENASEVYIAKSNEIIQTFYSMIQASDLLINDLNQDKIEAFAKGVQSEQNKEKRLLREDKFFDPEKARADSIERARLDFPNLF